jgi:hypothetical protein
MKLGHYFCSFCNDVVFQPFTERYEVCSRCGNRSAVWTMPSPKRRAVSRDEAKELFEQVHQAVKEVA